MKFELTTLGTASALPMVNRFPSAHVLNVHERLFLIECGEGCQMQLRRYKFSFAKINEIFISHLHGDHIFGIFGLLSTMSLLGRVANLTIFAPKGFSAIMASFLTHFGAQFKFEIVHKILDGAATELIFSSKGCDVFSFPLNHRVECYGFMFREREPIRNIKKELIAEHKLSLKSIAALKQGIDITNEDGILLKSEEFTYRPYRPRSFAYCSDTAPFPELKSWIRGVDLLYHEATFLDDNRKIAEETFHSTASDAARLALAAGVKKMIMGHFSSRYRDLSLFENEARQIFKESYVAREGTVIDIPLIKFTRDEK